MLMRDTRCQEMAQSSDREAKDVEFGIDASSPVSLHLICWTIRRCPLSKRINDDTDSHYDQNVCGIEYPRVEGAKANSDKIGHQAVTQKPIQEITHAASQDERKTDEAPQVQPRAGYQVCSQRDQSDSNPQSEDGESGRVRKQGSETQEGAGIFGEPQLN
jgi:hypothetical protein